MVRAYREKIMKPRALFSSLLAAAFCLISRAWADDLPKRQPFSHYLPMVKQSPFAVASAGVPAGATPDFAKNLYVANAAHSTDGDYVTLASTVDKELKEYLNTRETIDGYSISNIQWSDRVGETKVTISKDGQFATLTFNEALLSQALPVQAVPQPPLIPGQVRQNPANPRNPSVPMPVQRPMPLPHIPTPAPHTRGTIRRHQVPQHATPPKASEDDDDSDLDTPSN